MGSSLAPRKYSKRFGEEGVGGDVGSILEEFVLSVGGVATAPSSSTSIVESIVELF